MEGLSLLGRWLAILGLGLAAVGGLLWLLGRLRVPLGRLPGDFNFQAGGVTCFVPLATSILVSLFLTLALNLIARWLGR